MENDSLWEKYDLKFKPKRKVNNKSSNALPHIIGTFYSNKMDKSIEYESINEFILYTVLELDRRTFRYYVQPIEIEIKKKWIHIPDVLVFRDDMKPILYQVKEPQSKITNKTRIINSECHKYAEKNNWTYNVIYPKLLPIELINNIRFLTGFLKKRKGASDLIPCLIERLKNMKDTTIIELVNTFSNEMDALMVLPIIYHLIATGYIFTNIESPISEFSNISFYGEIDYFNYLKGVTNNANK
jgi:hypothetical protein